MLPSGPALSMGPERTTPKAELVCTRRTNHEVVAAKKIKPRNERLPLWTLERHQMKQSR